MTIAPDDTRDALVDVISLAIEPFSLADHMTAQAVAADAARAILDRFPNLELEPLANVYRIDRPRTRGTDPETSAAAAEQVRSGLRRPGGKVHRILRAYVDVTATTYAREAHPYGMTAREVEFVANVKAAHKRTSELLADGLLRVVTSPEGSDLVRKGGRVLEITEDGRAELRRMDRAIAVRDEKRRARDQRRRVRETGRA